MPTGSSCIVCGTMQSSESTLVRCNVREFREMVFEVWRCVTCGSLHSQEDVQIEPFYTNYPFKSQRLDLPTRLAYGNRLRNLQRRGLRRDHRILDFGCGSGLFIDFIKKRGFYNVFGYDAFVEKYSATDALHENYDVVTSQDVIEHFEDPREFFRAIGGLVSPQGFVAVGTPNADEITLTATERFLMELHQPYHRHILTSNALKKLALESGLNCFSSENRFYYDTLIPSVNTRFIKEYVRASGNDIDVAVEKPNITLVLTRPSLWIPMFFGYTFRSPGNMVAYFNKC